MGFNTTVVVLNDALDQIAKDPEFGAKLASAITKMGLYQHQLSRGLQYTGIDVSAGNHANAATVIETHHADLTSVVAIGGNMARTIGMGLANCTIDCRKELLLIQHLADFFGYNLVKR